MRCEGWRRHGGIFTLGPVEWEQCSSEAVMLLTVVQAGKITEDLPSCEACRQECQDRGIDILSTKPIDTKL